MAVREDRTIREPRNGRIRGGHERYGGREAKERRKKEEGRGKKEEGRGKKEEERVGTMAVACLRGDDGSLEPRGGRASKRPRGGANESRHWLTICRVCTWKMPNNDRKPNKMEENDTPKRFCAKCQDVEK